MALTLEKAFVIPLLITLVALVSQTKSRTLDETSIAQKHEQWIADNGRTYLDSTEKDKRFQIFKENYEYIEKFNNAGNKTFMLGINVFSDLKTEEFLATHTGLKMPPNPRVSKTDSFRNLNLTEDIPENVDWRDKGAVNDIKYQGECGCSWAISAVAAVEGAWKIKNGQLPILSEQQLVDCDTSKNRGCKGGRLDYAFQYIVENGGLAAESDYRFAAQDETCDQQKATNTVAKISSYQNVTPNNEQELKIAVNQQPVSIGISVGQEFQHYQSGIFNGSCGDRLNHAVTIVGYGKNDVDGTLYWLIGNSWGDGWGEKGYMKIVRESAGNPQGHCGLAMKPSYPIVMSSKYPPNVPGSDTPLPPPPTSTNSSDLGRKKKESRPRIAIGTAGSAVIAVLLFGSFFWCWWRGNRRDREESRVGNDILNDILMRAKQVESQDLPLFPLGLILEGTQQFSDENKLGEGGFGPVYKGTLADGKEVAVKRLSRTSGQGLQEFKNEVTLIAKLQHKNLVRLLGCCLEGNELLLVYEYMPNKSLDFLLFDATRSLQLDWKVRMGIIIGIARGILYLHEDSRLKIIHRDLKASNILLDHEMNPKISDFGMAKIFSGNQNEANTNRVVGTYGYMAPEYVSFWQK